jgi:hypothetical protein
MKTIVTTLAVASLIATAAVAKTNRADQLAAPAPPPATPPRSPTPR